MSSISNKFFITAIEDGTTIHGTLSSTTSLSQSWNGSGCNPNWENSTESERPLIYLNLYKGNAYVGIANIYNQKWYYNKGGGEILLSFNPNTGLNTNDECSGYFKLVSDYNPHGLIVPAIRIMKNLASDENLDIDLIRFEGDYKESASASPINFSTSIQIRLTVVEGQGFFGVINAPQGTDLTQDQQSITLSGTLYKANSSVSSYSIKWYVNEVYKATTTGNNTITLTRADVTEYALVRAEFYEGEQAAGEVKFTEFIGIDDVIDDEILYVQYDGANDNGTSLRTGTFCTVRMWVGRKADPSVHKDTQNNVSYPNIAIKLLRADATLNKNSLTQEAGHAIPAAIQSGVYEGYRVLTVPQSGDNLGKATVVFEYPTIKNEFMNSLTGFILATSSPINSQ